MGPQSKKKRRRRASIPGVAGLKYLQRWGLDFQALARTNLSLLRIEQKPTDQTGELLAHGNLRPGAQPYFLAL